jgi:hypothetical protein
MKWLAECSTTAFGEALRAATSALSGCRLPFLFRIRRPRLTRGTGRPAWISATVHREIYLFASCRAPAANEIGVLAALHDPAAGQCAEAAIETSPVRSCRPPPPPPLPCGNDAAPGSGRITGPPASAGATGPTPRSPHLVQPCLSMATCTAITRSGIHDELRLVANRRSPPEWVEDFSIRFRALGSDPEALE